MKKLIFKTLFLLLANSAFAGYGFFGDCASFVQVNNTHYKVSGCSSSGDPDFNGTNLGTITNLNLGLLQAFTYQNGGDNVMNSKLYYRIYTGSASGAFTEIDLSNYDPTDIGGGAQNRRWYITPNTDLISGLTPLTTYTLEIYIHSEVDWNVVDGTKDADIYINNGGSNHMMTFTVDASVPVELIDFSAKSEGNEVALTWITSSEQNNAGFEVQKSSNGNDFEKIGFVEGNGNSIETIHYQFLDDDYNIGKNYYRLKQIDYDSDFEYSSVIVVNVENEISFKIYPNPIQERLTIQGDLLLNSQIQLINDSGQIIYHSANVNQQIELDLSDYPNGIYFIRIVNEGKTLLTKKVVKN